MTVLWHQIARDRQSGGASDKGPLVSIVVPALGEQDNVKPLADRIRAVLAQFTGRYEIIFVSDGCQDTAAAVTTLNQADERVKLLLLSRSFGHQNAILAGLDHAAGQAVITMDGDLQHPPEAIPDLLAKWEQGYDVVHAVRRLTGRASSLTDRGRGIAYRLLRRLCDVDIVPQSADFRLYACSAAAAMCSLRERGRFNRGLARWIGFRQAIVHYDQAPRLHGRSEYSLVKLALLFLNGVFSLSSKPLHYLGVAGLGVSLLAALYLVLIVLSWALGFESYRAVAGWASTVAIVLFVGGMQMIGLWLMGQYLARTYDEVKGRPCYIVAEALGVESRRRWRRRERPRLVRRRGLGGAGGDEDSTGAGPPVTERAAEVAGHA